MKERPSIPARNVRGKKTRNPGYEPGNHWVICDVCACAIRAKDAMFRWDNAVVCPDDWEPRHPQDFVRGRADKIVPDEPIRPETDSSTDCTLIDLEDLPVDNITVGTGTGVDYNYTIYGYSTGHWISQSFGYSESGDDDAVGSISSTDLSGETVEGIFVLEDSWGNLRISIVLDGASAPNVWDTVTVNGESYSRSSMSKTNRYISATDTNVTTWYLSIGSNPFSGVTIGDDVEFSFA